MKLKNFTAKTYALALEKVKAEFGSQAVILRTRPIRQNQNKWWPVKSKAIEVTAALKSESMSHKKTQTRSKQMNDLENFLTDQLKKLNLRLETLEKNVQSITTATSSLINLVNHEKSTKQLSLNDQRNKFEPSDFSQNNTTSSLKQETNQQDTSLIQIESRLIQDGFSKSFVESLRSKINPQEFSLNHFLSCFNFNKKNFLQKQGETAFNAGVWCFFGEKGNGVSSNLAKILTQARLKNPQAKIILLLEECDLQKQDFWNQLSEILHLEIFFLDKENSSQLFSLTDHYLANGYSVFLKKRSVSAEFKSTLKSISQNYNQSTSMIWVASLARLDEGLYLGETNQRGLADGWVATFCDQKPKSGLLFRFQTPLLGIGDGPNIPEHFQFIKDDFLTQLMSQYWQRFLKPLLQLESGEEHPGVQVASVSRSRFDEEIES